VVQPFSTEALELLHDPAIIFAPEDEVVLDVNSRACEVYGLSREQFVGLSLREISRDAIVGEALIRETLARSEPSTFQTVQYRRDGEELRLSVRATPVDFQGRKAILTINRPVIAVPAPGESDGRIAAEWQFTLDAIPAAVLLLDDRCRIVRTNHQAFAMMSGGTTRDDVTGCGLRETTTGEPWREAERLARLAMRHDIDLSARVQDASGSHPTWSVVVRLAPAGRQTRAVVVVTDLTAMVDLEAEVRRVEQMADFGRVVAGVAHEIRTPLFALATTIELIEASLDLEDERVRRRVEMMREQITRLHVLTRDLLEYGKAPALDASLQTLDAVVADALALSSESAEAANVTLSNAFRGDDMHVLIDQQRMVTAVRNLIENAIQHAPAGSAVTIRGGVSAARDHLRCIVEDAGDGFPPQYLTEVMEPFFTRRAGGTGLGLAIVQRIVELHGGRVTAENRPEGGARVTIALPTIPPGA
jgi:PAS domain S-box-containing protein